MSGFQVAALLLAIAAVYAVVNERLTRLPATIGLFALSLGSAVVVALCMLFGETSFHSAIEEVVASFEFDHVVIDGMLSFLLFAGALHVPIRALEEQRWPIVGLAIFSTLLNTLFVGAVTRLGLWLVGIDLPWVHAFLFGALISPTDPIAALAILSKAGLSKRLETLFSGESLFNDGVGVVVFTIFASLAARAAGVESAGHGESHGVTRLIVQEIGGGVAGGLLLGILANLMIAWTSERSTHVLVTVAMVGSGYAACNALGISGPIAMVLAGLVVGNLTLRKEVSKTERHEAHVFWSMIDDLLNALLFLMLGFVYLTIPLDVEIAIAAPIAILGCLASRYLAVTITAGLLRLARSYDLGTRALVSLLTWGSLRGALSIALALRLDDGPYRDLVLGMTAAIVAFSILVQGLTIGKLYRRLARKESTEA